VTATSDGPPSLPDEPEPSPEPRERWAYAAILASPCLAVAATVGIAAGASWFLAGRGRSFPIEIVLIANAALAACGSGLAGFFLPGPLQDRLGRFVVFAVVGLFGYVALLGCGGLALLPP
jgi:hypothetical protein